MKWLLAALHRLRLLRLLKLKCLLARLTRARMWVRAFRLRQALLSVVRAGPFRA